MRTVITLAAAALLSVGPMLAHHSLDAEFDRSKPITVKGTVTKIEWQNPHIWVYVDVKDASGKVVKWQFEGGPPNALRRSGWTKDSLKEGDVATFKGLMARVDANIGKNTAHAETVTLPNGRSVFAGNAKEAAGPADSPQAPAAGRSSSAR